MGFLVLSSVSAADIDDSVSSEISDSGVTEISSSDVSVSQSSSDADSYSLDANTTGNVNSENEVLSTDTNEDGDLDSISKDSKSVLSSSAQASASALGASAKSKTTLKASSTSVKKGNSFSVTLTDSSGKALSGQAISFKIKNKTYTKTTNAKGVASLAINLNVGKYAIVCSYAGNSSYNASKLSATISVTKQSSSLKSNGNSIVKGKTFSVTLKDGAGNALANQKVKFTIKSKTYTKTTDANGVASLTINLNVAKYSITSTYAGTSNYLSSKTTNTISVTKASTSLKPSSTTVLKGKTLSIVLRDGSNNVLSGQRVGLTVKGKTYTLTTKSNGAVSLTIGFAAGKYAVNASYAGSSNYYSSKSSFTMTVTTSSNSSSGNSSSTNSFTVAQIDAAAKNLKAYVNANKTLPSTIKVGSSSLKISEFSYLMAKAITNLNASNKNSVALLSGISNGNSASNKVNATVYKAQYVDLAKRVVSYIGNNKVPPAYATANNASGSSVGNAGFNLYTFAFSKILDFYGTNNYLPNYCTFDSSVIKTSSSNSSSSNSSSTNASAKATVLKASSTSLTRGDSFTVTLTDSSGNPLASQKVTFAVGSGSYNKTTDSKGAASLTINLVAGKYTVTSSFAGSSSYKSSKLSSTITVVNSSSRFYIADITTAATNVKSYVLSNQKLPNTVTVANTKLTMAQFSYLMSKAIKNINASNNGYISLVSGISSGNSTGKTMSVTVYKAQYLDLAKRVATYIESNKVPPAYAVAYSSSGSSYGNAEYKLYSFAFSKILAFYKTNSYLPTYCTFDSSDVGVYSAVTNVTNNSVIKANSSQFKTGLNEKNTVSNLSAYLVGTGSSTITSSIQTLANKLTSGLNSTATKALAIYNYVRDQISYSYYANTRYGAAGTLSQGTGNCVDQANLVVALCRASGIHARYSHAQGCTFSSGLVTGHVWAQILVDGTWYSADATSVRNSLGNIVNWNTKSFNTLKQYAAVPF